jgi:hypothetical protein
VDISPKAWQNITMPEQENVPSQEFPENNAPTEIDKESSTEPEKTQKKPPKKKTMVLVAGALVLIAAGIYFLLPNNRTNGSGDEGEVQDPEIVERPIEEDPTETYRNDQYRFTVQYNSDLHTLSSGTPFTEQISLIQINYSDNLPNKIEKDTDLEEGYLVRVTFFDEIDRDVEDLIARKREKFRVECPITAEIGQIGSKNIDGISGRFFEVENCPQNFVVNMTEYGGKVFEITQVYRGDIGFRQSYRAQTEGIVRSFKWIRENTSPTVQMYRNEDYGIELSHPFLDTDCCSVTQPSIDQLSRLIILADSGDEEENGLIDDKFGMFGLRIEDKSFGLFLNQQKQSLIQEYKVVEGRDPTNLGEERLSIGGAEGVLLKNYAWWGEVVYLNHPHREVFLVIVVPRGVSEGFEKVIEDVLQTMVFLE